MAEQNAVKRRFSYILLALKLEFFLLVFMHVRVDLGDRRTCEMTFLTSPENKILKSEMN